MKIAIDAKWYFSGNISGKVVVRNLVNHFISENTNDEFFLFFQKKDKSDAKKLLCDLNVKNGVNIVFVPNSPNFINNMIIMPYYVKKHEIEVCLYQNFTPIFFKYNCKNIVYIHDFLFFDFPEYFSFIERKIFSLMRFTAKYADSIITISNSEKVRIGNHLKYDKIIYTVYHGVSNEFRPINLEEQSQIKKTFNLDNKFLLYIGRINVRKNIQTLLEAMPYLDKDLSLVIIGKKDNKSFDIEKRIQELDLTDRVKLLGHLKYEDLLKIIGTAEIFIFPSFAEGFGLPPLEAMKSGVPVIVSNTTCLPEICGDAALYFNPNNKDELINKINMLIKDEFIRNYYIELGFKHAENFKWSKSANGIMNILTHNK